MRRTKSGCSYRQGKAARHLRQRVDRAGRVRFFFRESESGAKKQPRHCQCRKTRRRFHPAHLQRRSQPVCPAGWRCASGKRNGRLALSVDHRLHPAPVRTPRARGGGVLRGHRRRGRPALEVRRRRRHYRRSRHERQAKARRLAERDLPRILVDQKIRQRLSRDPSDHRSLRRASRRARFLRRRASAEGGQRAKEVQYPLLPQPPARRDGSVWPQRRRKTGASSGTAGRHRCHLRARRGAGTNAGASRFDGAGRRVAFPRRTLRRNGAVHSERAAQAGIRRPGRRRPAQFRHL